MVRSRVNNERYDIVAKMEGDPPPVIPGTGADHMMLATRTLLVRRLSSAGSSRDPAESGSVTTRWSCSREASAVASVAPWSIARG
jgi:hypothetical protein